MNPELTPRPVNAVPLRVTAGDIALSVWEYPGGAPPLFFCHCAGLCGRTWDPVIRRLPPGNRAFAWDARGHGDSDKPLTPGAYAWDGFSGDLLAVLDALAFPQGGWAVGHSGGAASLVHAELVRPGTFSRMVLIDAIIAPAVFFPTAQPLADLSRRRVSVFDSPDAARARLTAKPPMRQWHPEVFNAYLEHGFARDDAGRLHLKCPGEIEARIYESGGLVNLYDRLHEIQSEALVITAANSYMLEHAREQCERLPHAALVELPDTGHFIPQERPLECAQLIADWFARV